MNSDELYDDSICAEQMHLAERELAAFIGAVRESFGEEQALLSAEDWLDASQSMDHPRRSTTRDWRAVTVAASARLASRLLSHEVIEPTARPPIRRYRQYHRPAVSYPLFGCDTLVAPIQSEMQRRSRMALLSSFQSLTLEPVNGKEHP
jgi:hypothetical protein